MAISIFFSVKRGLEGGHIHSTPSAESRHHLDIFLKGYGTKLGIFNKQQNINKMNQHPPFFSLVPTVLTYAILCSIAEPGQLALQCVDASG